MRRWNGSRSAVCQHFLVFRSVVESRLVRLLDAVKTNFVFTGPCGHAGPATRPFVPCCSSLRVGLRATSTPDAGSRRTAEIGDVSFPWIDFNVVLRWQSRRGAVVACSPSVRPRFAVRRKVLATSAQVMCRPGRASRFLENEEPWTSVGQCFQASLLRPSCFQRNSSIFLKACSSIRVSG